MSAAGLGLAQRQAQRQKYLDAAVARAATMGLTMRCRRVAAREKLRSSATARNVSS